MQIFENGIKTVRCQQYNENNLSPINVRAFEPASLCSSKSANVVQFLYNEAKVTGRSDLK